MESHSVSEKTEQCSVLLGVMQHAIVQSMLCFAVKLGRVAHLYPIGPQHVASRLGDDDLAPYTSGVLHSFRYPSDLHNLGVMGNALRSLGF
jgi:hypothetical protein